MQRIHQLKEPLSFSPSRRYSKAKKLLTTTRLLFNGQRDGGPVLVLPLEVPRQDEEKAAEVVVVGK